MRISQEADYAIRVVTYLTQTKQDIVRAKVIAAHAAITLPFLLKLLRKLIKSGIVQSFRGANGGYALAKPPEQMSLKEVIEAIDGPICLNPCLADPAGCSRHYTPQCKAHQALSGVNRKLAAELERINFRSILD